MTDTPGDLSEVNEADAIEQAQGADGELDDSSEELDVDDESQPEVDRMDADGVDVIEQVRTVKPARDEEYPTTDES